MPFFFEGHYCTCGVFCLGNNAFLCSGLGAARRTTHINTEIFFPPGPVRSRKNKRNTTWLQKETSHSTFKILHPVGCTGNFSILLREAMTAWYRSVLTKSINCTLQYTVVYLPVLKEQRPLKFDCPDNSNKWTVSESSCPTSCPNNQFMYITRNQSWRQFQLVDSPWKKFSGQFQLIVSEIICLENSN